MFTSQPFCNSALFVAALYFSIVFSVVHFRVDFTWYRVLFFIVFLFVSSAAAGGGLQSQM